VKDVIANAGVVRAKHSQQRIFLEQKDDARNASPQRPQEARLPINQIINIAVQIAEGLQAAHEKGIVHRDIKSANIMLTGKGQVQIKDFALAKVGGGSELTRAGSTLGTAGYMSPEQIRGEPVDFRSDIWSLGVVLYEMLTGKLPFKGEYEQAVLYGILHEEPAAISSLRSDVPTALEAIVQRMMIKNPDERYQTADEVIHDLRAIGGEQSGLKKPVAKQPKLPWMIAAAIVALLVIAFNILRPISKPAKEAVKTIAVLPFVDRSPNKDQEYFSDGLAEELLNVLAKNPQLRVTSRTSAFSFKGKDVDIRTIAAKLNVEHILEGSVRKSGNTIRITAQLIEVASDAQIWSKTYDGKLDDIFAVQDTISQSVAEALQITLLGAEAPAPQAVTNPQAYSAYLQGQYFYKLRGRENLEKAVGYYEQALAIDPNYARAWVGLGYAHMGQAVIGAKPAEESYLKARKEVEHALKLHPNLPEAFAAMGVIRFSYDWDWIGADTLFKRAMDLEPGNASTIAGFANLARFLGRLDEAIDLINRALELDRLNTRAWYALGEITFYAGQLEKAETAFRKALELNPQFPEIHSYIGRIYLAKEKSDLALSEMLKESDTGWRLFGLSLTYYHMGDQEKANASLEEFIKNHQNEAAYQIAAIYAYQGDIDNAFEWLERAYRQRDGGCVEMKGDPILSNIRKDPRYAAFMKKMKLPL
jgi:TolB-like protein/Flp pilus assembly protein TadD